MTSVEKGLSAIAIIIVVGLLLSWVYNIRVKNNSDTPTFKVGDPEPAKAFDTKLQEFNSELGK